MRFQCLISVATGLLVAGCSTVPATYDLRATDKLSQEYRTNPKTNATFIISRQQSSIVAVGVSPEHAWDDYGRVFDIKLKNTGRTPVQFGASKVAISSGGQTYQVLDYTAMVQAIKTRQNTKQTTATLAAIAGGIGAGLYAGSPNANPALSSAITQQVLASAQASSVSLANSKAEADVLWNESSKSFLTNVTIPPGGTFGGIVVVPQIAAGLAQVTVTVGADRHVFSVASR
jgi:hypothetical protein